MCIFRRRESKGVWRKNSAGKEVGRRSIYKNATSAHVDDVAGYGNCHGAGGVSFFHIERRKYVEI